LRTIREVLEPTLAEAPDREALVAANGRFSYAELDAAADRAAGALHALGIGSGDVVAVSLPNEADVVISFHAASRLGAVWLGVNRGLAPPEKRFILDDADAVLLVADEPTSEAMHAAGDPVTPTVVCGGTQDEWQALTAAGGDFPRTTRGLDEPAGIAYTSGTTGRPKGVVHSERNLLLPGQALVAARGFDHRLRRGDCAALTILNLQVTSSLLAVQAGGTQVVMDRVDALGIAGWIRAERITSWFGVPTMLRDLATNLDVEVDDLASLEDVWTGGTYCPDSVREMFERRFGKKVHATYGMTEVPTVVTIEPRDVPAVPGSSGQALPHLVVEIRGDDGELLAPGHAGQITVRGATEGTWAGTYTPMLGYRTPPSAGAGAAVDGVLHTGDVGELDADGNLHVRDRQSSVILRGGSNVYPAEVERVLLTVAGVTGAAVVGVPDERLGERVAAAVEIDDHATVSEELLRERCAAELARYKVPDRWLIAPLPRNAMGKVVRPEVQGWFA
jgi:acyl-CoA synthetase (AMP-forming)/AMP-acid ligase II